MSTLNLGFAKKNFIIKRNQKLITAKNDYNLF